MIKCEKCGKITKQGKASNLLEIKGIDGQIISVKKLCNECHSIEQEMELHKFKEPIPT